MKSIILRLNKIQIIGLIIAAIYLAFLGGC
jgi:hypothetical protein